MEEGESGKPECAVVLVTFPDLETGRAIARILLAERLVACVNLLPGGESLYEWEGQIQAEPECAGLIKTTWKSLDAARHRLLAEHPYEEPEFVVLRIDDGSPGYLDWVRRTTSVSAGEPPQA